MMYFVNLNINFMATLEQILNEPDDCSSLSADASFTLEDVLLEPDELIEDDDLAGVYFSESENSGEEGTTEIPFDEDENEQKIEKSQEEQNFSSSKGADARIQQKVKKPVSRERRLRDLQMPALNEVNNMTYIPLKNVTALFQNPQKNGVGIPTVITATGSRFLAIGTSLGNIALFQVGVKGYKLLGANEHKKYGQVTSLTISRDNKYLVGGQQGGLLTVWDLNYYSEIKRQLACKSKIIKLLFCTENEFVLNDIQGNIFLYTIQKYIWVNLKSQRIFQKTDAYFYDIKAHTLHSKTQILALCTLDYVLILTYKPQVMPLARLARPDDLYFSKLPNIQLGRCAVFSVFNPENTERQSSDVLCVSWSKSIFLYKFVEGRAQAGDSLQLMFRFEQESPIFNMQFISEGILVTLDNRQTFRTYRLWVNSGGGYMLINQREVPEEVIYQRFLKDKNNKFIKSYNNTIISCSFNPKDKELFFICKNSIYRCRIHRWNDAINELINSDRQFLKALKLCLQLFNNRFNIFLEPVMITEKTIKLFCEIGRLFLVEKLKEIEKLNEDRVKNIDQKSSIRLVQEEVEQAYQCLIEYMIQIKSQNYLFERIFREVIKQKHFSDEYHHKFIECLEPFILNGCLTRIPTLDLFRQITGYFLKQGKKALVDNLIISLQIQNIFYPEAIQICEENKLYRALAYVCSTHGEYVPPLNRLLKEIKDAQNNRLTQAQQIYYMVLKDYIVKMLGCIYINGNPLVESPEVMKKSLSTWLTCRQTFTFFTKNVEQGYQKDYFYFLEGMIQSLSQEDSLKDYIHAILKDLIKQKHKEKEIAQLFIKISATLQLDQQEITLILLHSTSITIQNNLNDYLEFIKRYSAHLEKHEATPAFLLLSKQLTYLYSLFLGKNTTGLLESTKILDGLQEEQNQCLVRFILDKLSSTCIAENIEDLLKIHSGLTMVYMLQKFSLDIVNERLMAIKDQQYRYLIIRKLLKTLRKDSQKNKKTEKKQVTGSKLSHSALHSQGESERASTTSLKSTQRQPRRRLNKEVMQFYIQCLCRYKREKRVYYELTSYLSDYADNLDHLVAVIQPFKYTSSLGLLEQSRKNFEKAYQYYAQVYSYYFFEENYLKLMRVVHCHGRFMRRIFERMLVIAEVTGSKDLWMDLLSCVINPLQQKSIKGRGTVCDDIQEVFKKKPSQPFLQQLTQILELCLINVSSKVPMEKFSAFIVAHGSIFVKQFVLSSFRSTLITYSKNAYIYLLANEMIVHDQVEHFQQIYSQKIKGTPFPTHCEYCSKQFEASNSIKLYVCGHAYHSQCNQPQRDDYKEQGKDKTEIQNEKEQEKSGKREDRCPKCIVLQTGGDQYRETQLPDFNISQENMLMRGMKGIAKIIPSMMSAIPNPINAFSKTQAALTSTTQEETVDLGQAEDEVYNYLAFEKTLEEKEKDFNNFLSDYQKYLDKYS